MIQENKYKRYKIHRIGNNRIKKYHLATTNLKKVRSTAPATWNILIF